MASATTTYNFTDEEVSHLANCNDQGDFLYNFQRILQSKGIDVTAVFDIGLPPSSIEHPSRCSHRATAGCRFSVRYPR